MPQRDPRYRGRRRSAPPRRKPGHLRTNYTEDDMGCFALDLAKLRSVWPKEVLEEDRRVAKTEEFKVCAIGFGIVMVPVSALAIGFVVDSGAPWWSVPVVQSLFLLVLFLRIIIFSDFNGSDDTKLFIYREADRRGIKYDKKRTPLYALMNKINADYNSHLWNRNFKWK